TGVQTCALPILIHPFLSRRRRMAETLARLGIRTRRDFLLFVVILSYALAILALMIGALARDFGLATFAAKAGRPVLLNLTPVTIFLSAIIFSLAILWLVFGF